MDEMLQEMPAGPSEAQARWNEFYPGQSPTDVLQRAQQAAKQGKSDVSLGDGEYMPTRQAIFDARRMLEGGDSPEGGMPDEGEAGATELYDQLLEQESGFGPLVPDTQANPREQRQFNQVVGNAGIFLFGDNMDKVVRVLRSDEDFYVSGTKVVTEVLAKEHSRLVGKGEKPEPAVFFSPEGVVGEIANYVVELGQKVGIPGAEDPNSYAAIVMGTFKNLGEHLIKSGDDKSLDEAEKLAVSIVASEGQGGQPAPVMPPKQKPLPAGIQQGLLGEQVNV